MIKTERIKFVDIGKLAEQIAEHVPEGELAPLPIVQAAIKNSRPLAGARAKLPPNLPRHWRDELAEHGIIQHAGYAYAYGGAAAAALRRLLDAWEAYAAAPAGLRHTFDAEELPLIHAVPALDAIGVVFARFGLNARRKLWEQVPEGDPREAQIETALEQASKRWA